MSDALVPYGELERMADVVVRGGLFPGIKTQQQALTLFLVAQAEGLHPMTAVLRYNVIQGRPAMKAEAMLASFMERGGTVDWIEYTDAAVTGVFTSKGVPSGVTVRCTMADAKRAGVTMNQTWTKYPRQMLKARVASDGVRMADPAVNSGRYTPEEVSEFKDEPKTVAADAEIVDGSRAELATGGIATHRPGEGSQDGLAAPDLTDALTASLKVAEDKKAALQAGKCPHCQSDCAEYKSTQAAHLGRTYLQCEFAHKLVEEDILQGVPVKEAQAAVTHHRREWVGPPVARKTTAVRGAAPKGQSEAPEGPASIFDPAAIEREVAERLARE